VLRSVFHVDVRDGRGKKAGVRVVALDAAAGLRVTVGLSKAGLVDGVFTIDQPRGFMLDQAVGLAQQVLAGNPEAVTRPTAPMELAAAVLVLYGMHVDLDLADDVAGAVAATNTNQGE
jgi:hypothetical protein